MFSHGILVQGSCFPASATARRLEILQFLLIQNHRGLWQTIPGKKISEVAFFPGRGCYDPWPHVCILDIPNRPLSLDVN